jgi:hypothetical protein
MFAEWNDLSPAVLTNAWSFLRVGQPVGDGGSIFYDFSVAGGHTVSVVAAHPNYWTKEDFQKSRQPFFLYAGNKMHRFDPSTPEEQVVTKAIGAARDVAPAKMQVILKRLLEQIESRKPLFNARS